MAFRVIRTIYTKNCISMHLSIGIIDSVERYLVDGEDEETLSMEGMRELRKEKRAQSSNSRKNLPDCLNNKVVSRK